MPISPPVSDQTRLLLRNRPIGTPVGYSRWHDLLFVHWQVPAEALAARLPLGMELDTFNGTAWLGLVPFEMSGVRPKYLPVVPDLSRFPETNLRTYVVCRGEPGVYFFSLDAANAVAVWAARRFFHLPYYCATMDVRRDGPRRIYRSTRRERTGQRSTMARASGSSNLEPPSTHIEAEIGKPIGEAQPGTLEFFLVERYLLFTMHRGHVLRGQVHHRPYSLHEATIVRCEETLSQVQGFEALPPPQHAIFSPVVDVEVFPLQRVELG